eukprot:3142241-Pyramimonas_sp.AAC.1
MWRQVRDATAAAAPALQPSGATAPFYTQVRAQTWTIDERQWTVDRCQWTIDRCQWTIDECQWTIDECQWTIDEC